MTEKTVEKEEQSSIEDCEKLACDIGLELRQAIDVLEMLVDQACGVPDEFICLMSTPAVLIKALEGTVEKSDIVHSYLFKCKEDVLPKLKEETKS